jgi:hypothetical protein
MENKIATISEMMVIVLFMNYYLLNYYGTVKNPS